MSVRTIAVIVAAAGLLGAGCMARPGPPDGVWVPGYYAYGPYGHYWVEGYWRVP
jgi:hypothetical protein